MSVTNHLCDEEVHVTAIGGAPARIAVEDAFRLSEKTGLPVVLNFNGKKICISWSEAVGRMTSALLNGLPS